MCLWSYSRTENSLRITIAPHWSSLYPDYLSPTWEEDTQRAVVWSRLKEHCKLANHSLAKVNEQFHTLCQETLLTQVDSSHEPLSHDNQPWDISIDLIGGDNHALDCKVYPLTSAERPKLGKHILNMSEKGFIHPSKSKICSLLFFVGKKDGKEHPVMNYRRPNLITEPDQFPIPLLQEMIDKVQRAKLFSKVDICKGFYNIHVMEGNKWKAAFKTNTGLYEPTVMQFRPKNAPAVFRRMMNTQFVDLIAQGNVIILYIDKWVWVQPKGKIEV